MLAVATLVWFATPTKAFDITFPSLPSSGTLGGSYSFSVTMTIADQEILPIQSVDLYIFKNTTYTSATSPYKATLANLPLNTGSQSYTSAQTGGGSATVTAAANWTFVYGSRSVLWKGTPYPFGYGYGYGGGVKSITYNITWTPLFTWPAGDYKAETKLTANTTTFTETSSSFSLSTAVVVVVVTAPPTVVALEAMTPAAAATIIEAMTPAAGAAIIGEVVTAKAADIIEQVVTAKAADIIEQIVTAKAADIIEQVTTNKGAGIIEQVTTGKGAGIIEQITTNKGAGIIEQITTGKGAGIIEQITTGKGAGIIEQVTTGKGTGIIETVTTEKAAGILEKVVADKAAAVMEGLTTGKLTSTISAMSETSLTDRLPELSPAKLYSVIPEILFKSVPNAPTEQLVREEPPQPAAGTGAPTTVATTPAGARYRTPQTVAGGWAVVVSTPPPVDQLMIKTRRALANIETTLEVFVERPSEATVGLPTGQIAQAYLTIAFGNATPEDIELGHMTFKVEKSWLEQNSIHKWSVALNRYDPELKQWIALPTKRVKEDDSYVYYTVSITRFSTFAVSGSQTLSPLSFQVANLTINPANAKTGEDITVRADTTNLSDRVGTYVATLWINNTIESGKDIYLKAGETKPVSFSVTRTVEGSYDVRFERLFGNFSVTKAPPVLPVPPALLKPAAFTASNLTITPAEVKIGEGITISALITNTGDLAGSYQATIKINNTVVATKDVALAGIASQKVTFTTTRDVAGTYTVNVDGLSGTFTVKAALPPPPPPVPINWWLISGIIAAAIAIIVVIILVVRRQRA